MTALLVLLACGWLLWESAVEADETSKRARREGRR